MEIEIWRSDRFTILYCAKLNRRPDLALFRGEQLPTDGAGVSFATGRGDVLYREFDDHPVVVRHYRRGGAARRLSDDTYWYTGLRHTRMWRELDLLLRLHSEGLPVPVPVAALIERKSVCLYRGDLVTRKIPNAETLAALLARAPLDAGQWSVIGRVVRQFHERSFFHADLNAGNIMIDSAGAVHLIDLDRGRLFGAGSLERFEPNLQRLKRSLKSFVEKHPEFNFSVADWSALMKGYVALP